MSTEFKWYGKQVQALINKSVYAGLEAACQTVEGKIIEKINSMDIIDTGRYKGSIGFKTRKQKSATGKDGIKSNPKEFQGLIGTNLFYAQNLEYGTGIYAENGGRQTPWFYYYPKIKRLVKTSGYKPRPAIRQAWDATKGKLDNIFTAQFKKVFNAVKI